MCLEYASTKLKSNRNIVLAAVALDGLSLNFACPSVLKDYQIVETAVIQKGSSIISSSLRFDYKNTLEFIFSHINIVIRNPSIISKFSNNIKSD